MEESTILGITASQFPLVALIVAIVGVLIAVMAFVAVQINNSLSALRADMNALRAEMTANDNALRSDMNANRAETRADFRALEARFDVLSIGLAQIKGMLGVSEDVADASAGAE